MAGHGGHRPGAGRKPGSKTKATNAAIEKAEKGGILPLDYMLAVMRNPKAATSRRDKMAGMAAPYLHHRLQATTIAGNPNEPVYFVMSNRPPKAVRK